MQVWLLTGNQIQSDNPLENQLGEALGQLTCGWWVETRTATVALPDEVQTHSPDVLVWMEGQPIEERWLVSVLDLGVGVILVPEAGQIETLSLLCERHALLLVPVGATVESLAWAVQSVAMFARQRRALLARLAQTEQRLQDRILIERAKWLIIQSRGWSEEEAYKRLRVLARQQRQSMREIARRILESRELLLLD